MEQTIKHRKLIWDKQQVSLKKANADKFMKQKINKIQQRKKNENETEIECNV